MLSSPLYRLGRKLYSDARLEISQNDISTNGEADLQKKVIDLFSDEKVVIFDVGANVGEWSAKLLDRAIPNKIKIHAFEPVKEIYDILRENLQFRISDNVLLIINNLAISNEIGEKLIYLSGNLAGSNSLHGTPEAVNSETIRLTTIDQYCLDNQIDHIHLVKIDIEGHDMLAIQGAKKMLTYGRINVLQFEYNHRWIYSRQFLKDVFDFRDAHFADYQIGKLTGDGIFIFKKWHYELEKYFEGNYLLLHSEMLDKLNCRIVSFDRYNALT